MSKRIAHDLSVPPLACPRCQADEAKDLADETQDADDGRCDQKDADPFRQCRTTHTVYEPLTEINDIAYGMLWLAHAEGGDPDWADYQAGDAILIHDDEGREPRLMARIIHVQRGGFVKKGFVLITLADICQARPAEPTE
jgi:hypothetical protein